MAIQDKTNTSTLDSEIDLYTTEYEQEKTQLDRRFRDALTHIPAENKLARQRLWSDYRIRIAKLQHKVFQHMKKTSVSALRNLAFAVIPKRKDD